MVTTLAGTSNAVPVQLVDTEPGIVSRVPVRILDVWADSAQASRCLQVGQTNGVPAGATGVVLNVTAIAPYGSGHVAVYPEGTTLTPVPTTSTVNFEVGREVANSAFVALSDSGRICYHARGVAGARVLLDLTGFVMGSSGVVLADPFRILDTRSDTGQIGPVSGPVPRAPCRPSWCVARAGCRTTRWP